MEFQKSISIKNILKNLIEVQHTDSKRIELSKVYLFGNIANKITPGLLKCKKKIRFVYL